MEGAALFKLSHLSKLQLPRFQVLLLSFRETLDLRAGESNPYLWDPILPENGNPLPLGKDFI